MPPRRQPMNPEEIAQLVVNAMAAFEAQRNAGPPPHNDGANDPPAPKPCTYKDFMNCKPLSFKGPEGAVGLMRWIEKMESVFRICNCAEEDKVKFSTCTLADGALSWWNAHSQTVGIDAAYQLSWEELKRLIKEEYCPREQLQQLEAEFWNLTVKDDDIISYTTRFHQLENLCPTMVDPEFKRIERYIWGLPASIQGMVTASNPGTIQSAVRMAHNLMSQVVRRGKPAEKSAGDGKRKWQGSNQQQQPNKKPDSAKAYTSGSGSGEKKYHGSKPYCSKCTLHHDGPCGNTCTKCK